MNTKLLEPEKWMLQYFEYLKNYAKKKLSDEHLIEDLVQDTFLAALKSANNFRGESSERTWLMSILKHKIIDQYRRNNSKKGKFIKQIIRQSNLEGIYHKEISTDTFNNSQAEAYTNYTDIQNIISHAKKKLTNKENEAFELKIMQGHDTKFICKKLCISRENLWTILHRARKKIQKNISKEWYN